MIAELRFFPAADADASDQFAVFWLGWAFSAMVSPVFGAFGYTLLAWLIASVGVLAASRGPVLAALVFAFAAFAASPGLRNDYWYVTVPSVLVLVWLALAAWSMRNWVEIADADPARAAELAQQRKAILQREISQEDVIARR